MHHSPIIAGSRTDEEDDVSYSNINCKYFDIDEFCASKFDSCDSFSTLHLNIASLNAHFDEFSTMLNLLDFNFSVIGLTETRIKHGVNSTIPITLNGYNYEHTPTESQCGGALLYLSEKLNYKPRNDLLMYKPKLLESVFVEILCPKNQTL